VKNVTQFNTNSFIVCFFLTITTDMVRKPLVANYRNWVTSVFHKKSILLSRTPVWASARHKHTHIHTNIHIYTQTYTYTHKHARYDRADEQNVLWSSLANDADVCKCFPTNSTTVILSLCWLLPTRINLAVAIMLCPPLATLRTFPLFAETNNETYP
jgi:hypothetical protein